MVGLALYGILAVLMSHRIFFFDLKPDDATPVLWVVMGAAAISANAGSELIIGNGAMPFLGSLRPLRRRPDARDVGLGDLADPSVGSARAMEARRTSHAAHLYADAMVHRVPAWHVCRGKLAALHSRSCSRAGNIIMGHDLDRVRRLGRDRHWVRHFIVAPCADAEAISAAAAGVIRVTSSRPVAANLPLGAIRANRRSLRWRLLRSL
jgi:hypothetical protein